MAALALSCDPRGETPRGCRHDAATGPPVCHVPARRPWRGQRDSPRRRCSADAKRHASADRSDPEQLPRLSGKSALSRPRAVSPLRSRDLPDSRPEGSRHQDPLSAQLRPGGGSPGHRAFDPALSGRDAGPGPRREGTLDAALRRLGRRSVDGPAHRRVRALLVRCSQAHPSLFASCSTPRHCPKSCTHWNSTWELPPLASPVGPRPVAQRRRILLDKTLTRLLGAHAPRINTTIGFAR